MTESSRYFAGIGCVLAYTTIASLQSVALNAWLSSVNVYLIVALSFTVVTGCFLAASLVSRGARIYRFLRVRWRLVLALNVTSVFNWLCYFLAVKYLEPAVAVTLTQGVGPLSMTAYNMARGVAGSRVTRLCHGVILVAATLMCVYVVRERVTTGPYSRTELAIAIMIAVLCSISITATVLLSKVFATEKIPASAVLSVRFPLLIVVCAAVLPSQSDVRLDGPTLGIVLAVALLGITAATYFLQRGVEMAPALAVSTCLALSPVVVYAIGAVSPSGSANLTVLTLISTIVVVSLISIIYDGTRIRAAADSVAAPVDPLTGPSQPADLPARR